MEQCFDGKSQFDTPTWFTTDNFHKRYTKAKPSHNVIQTKASMLFSEFFHIIVKLCISTFAVKMRFTLSSQHEKHGKIRSENRETALYLSSTVGIIRKCLDGGPNWSNNLHMR